MKLIRMKVLLIMILVLMAGEAGNSQPTSKRANGISLVSEDQKAKRHILRVSQLKDMQKLKAQIAENKSHFCTLMSSENPDLSALYINIDELGMLRSKLTKSRILILKTFLFFKIRSET